MPVTIRDATQKDMVAIQTIAAATWPIAYAEILSGKQVAYMMNMMYRSVLLKQQLQLTNHFYCLLTDENGTPSGFYHLNQSEESGAEFKLNKIYLLPQMHGRNFGRLLLNHAEDLARQKGGKLMQLQVNQHNNAKKFYQKCGYTIACQQDFDIGSGFFMNDFIMEKQLN